MTNLFLDKIKGGKKKHKDRDKHRDRDKHDTRDKHRDRDKHGDRDKRDTRDKHGDRDKHRDRDKHDDRDKHGDINNTKNKKGPNKKPPLSETDLMKYIKFLGEFDDVLKEINLTDRIRENIFKKVKIYKEKPNDDSYKRISDYLKGILKKSNEVLHQLKTTYSEIKVSNKDLRVNGQIKWGFANLIEIDKVVHLGSNSSGYNISLLIAKAIITRSIDKSNKSNNSLSNYNYNSNYNNDISIGNRPDEFSIYKDGVNETDREINTSKPDNIKPNTIKGYFTDDSGSKFNKEILYWEYLICIYFPIGLINAIFIYTKFVRSIANTNIIIIIRIIVIIR